MASLIIMVGYSQGFMVNNTSLLHYHGTAVDVFCPYCGRTVSYVSSIGKAVSISHTPHQGLTYLLQIGSIRLVPLFILMRQL